MGSRRIMTDIVYKELQTNEEFLEAFPIMNQLRTHLDKTAYLDLVNEAMEKDRYRMLGLYDHSQVVAVVGFKPMVTLYYGRFIWVCDLVTDQNFRSKGYGKKLLSYVHRLAIEEGYENVALSSGLQRVEAHHFYEDKMDYDRVSYVFKKRLN